ncbi:MULTISPECIES: hypothetical protein [Bradyrhizobium]|uniref:hypothetical protein n=1 Tax=Bradyrhizobium TaxID=374 RepID=UPI001B8A4983|nr:MULTISPECIES: hypothetical protein [Bradyrhizobium]MBR0972285.1 hypothetical protein [Bradyrhizobium japonicum]MBR0972325.1 hypothetical protein [Bradyrhizobium japonicum]
MTSISALSSHHHHTSPLQRLQDELQAEAGSGTINSADQPALSPALGDIDSALQSSSASDQSSGGTSSPEAFKSKIDGLIQQEVSAGKLTDQQATELQGIFKAALSHGPGGTGGPGGAGGPPPDGPARASGTDNSSSGNSALDLLQQFLDSLKSLLADSTSSSGTESSDTTRAGGSSSPNATDSSTSGDSATDLLEQFLQSLKNSLADSTYSAVRSGDQTNASDSSISGVLIDDRI